MTHREHIYAVLEGKKPVNMPFFPDITDWYSAARTPKGQERVWGAAQFIPDSEPFHTNPGTMPEKYREWTLFDFYRKNDWGFPVHIGDWFKKSYSGDVKVVTERKGRERHTHLVTPKGTIRHVDILASDGTWGPFEHYVKEMADLDIMQYVVEHTHFTPTYENVLKLREQMGDWGEGDLVIFRSPFGKLVHMYMGFEKVIYALFDDEKRILDFMKVQEAKDMELVRLAAACPGERLVIISDHADENLIAPNQYEEFCIPFYQKACQVLHDGNKFVSTHLDGNFKGYFPLIAKTGFDVLDGCTPAPMFNYELEALAEAMGPNQKAFVGVPSTLFCQKLPTEKLLTYADRVMTAFKGRGILNVGDILPPDGDIEQVIAVGEYVKKSWK
ncbi:MAG: uroporphyrinogen decarboxylase family protein [Fibrobacterota bacterium]